jgi:hypothetical protein
MEAAQAIEAARAQLAQPPLDGPAAIDVYGEDHSLGVEAAPSLHHQAAERFDEKPAPIYEAGQVSGAAAVDAAGYPPIAAQSTYLSAWEEQPQQMNMPAEIKPFYADPDSANVLAYPQPSAVSDSTVAYRYDQGEYDALTAHQMHATTHETALEPLPGLGPPGLPPHDTTDTDAWMPTEVSVGVYAPPDEAAVQTAAGSSADGRRAKLTLHDTDKVGLSRHLESAKLLKGLGDLRLTAMVSKLSQNKRGDTLKQRVLVLTDSHVCDFEPSSYKCVHAVELKNVKSYSFSQDSSTALIIYIDHTKDSTKDFLMVTEDRDMICKYLARVYKRLTQTILDKHPWVPTYPAEQGLIALMDPSGLALDAGKAAGEAMLEEDEMFDDIGLARHPKAAKLLKGVGNLKMTATVSKVANGNQLKQRVLVLTDTHLCDFKVSSLKIVHSVHLKHVKSYSVSPTNDEAFIIYVDHEQDSTKDFLMASKNRDLMCRRISKEYQQHTKHELQTDPWQPSYAAEKSLMALIDSDGVAMDLPENAHQEDLVDEIGLSRDPNAAKIMKGLGNLSLATKISKVSEGKKGNTLKDRVLVLTDSHLCDFDDSSFKFRHVVQLKHINAYSVVPAPLPGSPAVPGPADIGKALIIYIDHVQDSTKDFLLIADERDLICRLMTQNFERLTNRSLNLKVWRDQYMYEKALTQILLGSDGDSESDGPAAPSQKKAEWLDKVDGDEVGFLRNPKASQILKKGEVLELAVRTGKVGQKSGKLKERWLVLSDKHMCDVEESSCKCRHRVKIQNISAFSVAPDNEQAMIIYIDRENDSTTDFLLASASRERVLAILATQYLLLTKQPLRKHEWTPTYQYERQLLSLTGGSGRSITGGSEGFLAKRVSNALSKHLPALAPMAAMLSEENAPKESFAEEAGTDSDNHESNGPKQPAKSHPTSNETSLVAAVMAQAQQKVAQVTPVSQVLHVPQQSDRGPSSVLGATHEFLREASNSTSEAPQAEMLDLRSNAAGFETKLASTHAVTQELKAQIAADNERFRFEQEESLTKVIKAEMSAQQAHESRQMAMDEVVRSPVHHFP